ncbi:MAG: hypothetical protein AAGA26_06650, partial [Pseudomonadota bacterium]
LGTVGFPDARPMLLDLVAGTMIALGLDFALCAVIVTGQLVLGLGMALVGRLLAPRTASALCDLTASLSLPLLALVLLVIFEDFLAATAMSRMTIPIALMMAGAPLVSLRVIDGLHTGFRTPWYLAARETGLSVFAASRRHIWPDIAGPLSCALASLALQTLAIILALGAHQAGWLGIEPTLGGILRYGIVGFHAVDLIAIVVPCAAIVALFLGLGLIRRGCGS